MKRSFGRLYIPDARDGKFMIPRKATRRTTRYWNQNGWWGNQKATSQCVGYGWAHWLEDGPVTHVGKPPVLAPKAIYQLAQVLDEWPGEDYDGTSVRGGAKALRQLGYVSEFRWAFSLSGLINAVLEQGPVVVGTNWYAGMMDVDHNGFIHVVGDLLGGHAYVVNGVNVVDEKLRLKNSWGRGWGRKGNAWISFDDTEALIREDGEVCLAVETVDKTG